MARTYSRRWMLRSLAASGLLAGCSLGMPGPTPPAPGGIIYSDSTRILRLDPDAAGVQSAPRVIFDAGEKGTIADPAWSPDGARIAYSYTPTPEPGKTYGSDIHVISASGTDSKAVFTHDTDGGLARAPTWAPDGQAIYFSYTYNQSVTPGRAVMVQQIERIDLTSGARAIVANDADLPSLSPDGAQIAFIRYPGDDPGAPSIWLARADGSEARQIVASQPFLSLWAPRFAPDSRSILFTGAAREEATPRLKVTLNRAGARLWEPSVAVAHGFPGDLWLCDTSTDTTELLAMLGADDLYTAWEPTGQRVVLLSAEGIHTVDLGAGTLRQLTPTAGYGAIDWARVAGGQ